MTRWGLVAYDDCCSIKYSSADENLRPYWRRNGAEAADLLQAAPVSMERNPVLPGYFADPSLCYVGGDIEP